MELRQYKLKGTVTAVQLTKDNAKEVMVWANCQPCDTGVMSYSWDDNQFYAKFGSWIIKTEYDTTEVLTDDQFKLIFKDTKK